MQLDIRLDGFEEPIGLLSSSWATGATTFSYTQGYASREDALPLSLALPLSKKQFNDFDTRAYFDNLLQERDSARADIIAKYRLANDDIEELLKSKTRKLNGINKKQLSKKRKKELTTSVQFSNRGMKAKDNPLAARPIMTNAFLQEKQV